MKGRHPQETRREHEACRRGEAQPSQWERLAPRGRGQDLLDEPRGNRLLLCPAPSLQDVGAQAIQDTRHPLGVADQDLEGWRKDWPPGSARLPRAGEYTPGFRPRSGARAWHGGRCPGPHGGGACPADAAGAPAGRPAQSGGAAPWQGQVRQLPQLLEGLEGQVLRLINDERHITAHGPRAGGTAASGSAGPRDRPVPPAYRNGGPSGQGCP